MADNVTVSTGNAAAIATDDVGGVHYQRVKLDYGGDGATVPVVLGAGLPAGSPAYVVTVTPAVTTTAYADGDALGTSMVIADAARANSGTGVLNSITLVSDTTTPTANSVDVFILNAATTGSTITDNSALSIVDGDGPKIITCVTLDEAYLTGAGKILCAKNINVPFIADSSADLHAIAAHRATWTFASTVDIRMHFGLTRD